MVHVGCYAQNLIPNGDFESYSGCPTNFSQIDSALYWTTPTAISSSDYYNQCATSGSSVSVPFNGVGFQEASDGIAYSGIYLIIPSYANYREYIEVPLSDTLAANACYYFSMRVNLTNTCKYSTAVIGAYFSDSAITGVTGFFPLPVVASISNSGGQEFDTLNWTEVSGAYLATGNETYLIIGNFEDDNNTPLTLVNNNAPFDFVYVLVDQVSLTPCKPTSDESIINPVLKIYPNPSSDYLTIEIENNEETEVTLYDLTGRKLIQQKFVNIITINLKDVPCGFYWYEVRNRTETLNKGIVAKQK